jgi:gamma-glutamyl:cysteine ligase YbdK (ATP-grasp superfamily)
MSAPYPLFGRFGVELEYMLVDRGTLAVRPISDEVLRAVTGEYTSDADVDDLTWSNELVLHVIELKTAQPAVRLEGLAESFQAGVRRINSILEPHGAVLMPGAMHPWMDPHGETKLWPHDCGEIYETFNRIFDCRGHGWSNLQCVHLNLPFADDDEFGRLHAAVRLVLPILPALAASSPIIDGRPTGFADTRLEVYRSNARRIPSVSGRVIPEPVFTMRGYEEQILQRIYRDLSPHDPEGVLRYEWANARGAIARFERNTIEIRVIDVQECPRADLAILWLVVAVLRALAAERWCDYGAQCAWPVEPLEEVLLATIRDADQAVIRNPAYLRALGQTGVTSCTAGELWRHLLGAVYPSKVPLLAEAGAVGKPVRILPPPTVQSVDLVPLNVILSKGCLSRRILRAIGGDASRERIDGVYRELCGCLAEGRLFAR